MTIQKVREIFNSHKILNLRSKLCSKVYKWQPPLIKAGAAVAISSWVQLIDNWQNICQIFAMLALTKEGLMLSLL